MVRLTKPQPQKHQPARTQTKFIKHKPNHTPKPSPQTNTIQQLRTNQAQNQQTPANRTTSSFCQKGKSSIRGSRTLRHRSTIRIRHGETEEVYKRVNFGTTICQVTNHRAQSTRFRGENAKYARAKLRWNMEPSFKNLDWSAALGGRMLCTMLGT